MTGMEMYHTHWGVFRRRWFWILHIFQVICCKPLWFKNCFLYIDETYRTRKQIIVLTFGSQRLGVHDEWSLTLDWTVDFSDSNKSSSKLLPKTSMIFRMNNIQPNLLFYKSSKLIEWFSQVFSEFWHAAQVQTMFTLFYTEMQVEFNSTLKYMLRTFFSNLWQWHNNSIILFDC